VYSVTKQ